MTFTTVSAAAGVAKQTTRGTLAANPKFAHGLSGGAPIAVEATQAPLEVTTAKRTATNVVRESVKSSGEIQSPAYMKALGLYLLGALGSVTTTGSGPYTHTFATGDLPYLSVYAKNIGAELKAIRDCKVDEFSLKWEAAKPLELTVKVAGTVLSFPVSFSADVDETGSESFLVPIGGTFSVDVAGGTPASARVVGGELTIKNNIATIDLSSSIEPSDVFEGKQDHELKLTIVPDNLDPWRSVVTGSASGTEVSAVVPTGSVSLQFKENAGSGTLSVTGSKVAFLTELPEANPSGEVVELELAGTAVMPSGGTSPLVYVLSNAQASY